MNGNTTFAAFSMSPVPPRDPTPHRRSSSAGSTACPMFVNVPTGDLTGSADFWCRGSGFFDFFTVPDRITHLQRWAFQDVLLVPGQGAADTEVPTTVSFSCVLGQVEEIAEACEELRPGSSSGSYRPPWNTVDVQVRTPEGTRVVMTAARPFDPGSTEAAYLRGMGIEGPEV